MFRPGEGGESSDPAAFERFKEQMKKNAAFIAASKKGEQKQKQKEDRLAKILLKFIQGNKKSSILMAAAKLLEENIPPSFVLSIIVLGNEELQRETEEELKRLITGAEHGSGPEPETEEPQYNEFAIATRFANNALPIKLKAEIDDWARGIFEAGSSTPFNTIKTVITDEGLVKKVVIDCGVHVLTDFFETNNGPHVTYDQFFGFCELLFRGVMKRLKEQIENQKNLN